MSTETRAVRARTGEAYLRGLKGRRIYLAGRLVESPADEPDLRAMAHLLATLVEESRTEGPLVGSDGTPLAYALASTEEALRARGRAFREMALRGGGLMGRSPDFLATVLTAWRGASGYFGARADNLVTYWEQAAAANLVLSHAISDPPGDRYLEGGAGQALRAVRETSEGLVVRGAKMLATLAPFADDLLVYPFRPLDDGEADQALCIAVPVDSPGLTLYSRPALGAPTEGNRPLASRFDELDAICVFDDVLVPWQRVFMHGDVRLANGLRQGTGMTAYAWHQSAVRSWVKAEFVFELARAAARVSGRDGQAAVRQQLGELAGIVETLRGLVVSAEAGARRDRHGNVVADPVPLAAVGMVNATLYPRAVELLQLIVSSGLIVHPVAEDEEPGSPGFDFIQRYFAGVETDGVGHGRLLRAAADLALDRFGGRQVLYERVFLGPPDAFRAKFYQQYVDGRPDSGMLANLLA